MQADCFFAFFPWHFEIPKMGKAARTPNCISVLSAVAWHNRISKLLFMGEHYRQNVKQEFKFWILWRFFFCTNSELKTLSHGPQTKLSSAINFMHCCSFSQHSLTDFFPCCFHSLIFPSPFLFLYSSSCILTASAVLQGSWVEESRNACKSLSLYVNWDLGSSGNVKSQLLLRNSG